MSLRSSERRSTSSTIGVLAVSSAHPFACRSSSAQHVSRPCLGFYVLTWIFVVQSLQEGGKEDGKEGLDWTALINDPSNIQLSTGSTYGTSPRTQDKQSKST